MKLPAERSKATHASRKRSHIKEETVNKPKQPATERLQPEDPPSRKGFQEQPLTLIKECNTKIIINAMDC